MEWNHPKANKWTPITGYTLRWSSSGITSYDNVSSNKSAYKFEGLDSCRVYEFEIASINMRTQGEFTKCKFYSRYDKNSVIVKYWIIVVAAFLILMTK